MNDYIGVDYSESEEALEEAAEALEEAGYETQFIMTSYADNLQVASEHSADEALEEFFDDLTGQLGMEVEGVPEEQGHGDDKVYVNVAGDDDEPYHVHHPTGDTERIEEAEELLGI